MLSIVEGRIVGCLMEKERTVPDQYPLTMNVLLSACNQSTSRDPVMRLDEHEVLTALTSLKSEGFVRLVHPSHGRSATRYRHVADERLALSPGPAALISVLLLRGPQTLSELRTRTERQHPFSSLDEIDTVLQEMAAQHLVRLLDRQPGQKEVRWQQLVAEEAASVEPATYRPVAQAPFEPASYLAADSAPVAAAQPVVEHVPDGPGLAERVAQLEARVATLEAALGDLL